MPPKPSTLTGLVGRRDGGMSRRVEQRHRNFPSVWGKFKSPPVTFWEADEGEREEGRARRLQISGNTEGTWTANSSLTITPTQQQRCNRVVVMTKRRSKVNAGKNQPAYAGWLSVRKGLHSSLFMRRMIKTRRNLDNHINMFKIKDSDRSTPRGDDVIHAVEALTTGQDGQAGPPLNLWPGATVSGQDVKGR